MGALGSGREWRRDARAAGRAPLSKGVAGRGRPEIADGSYLSDDKLDSVVGRLVGELFGD